MIEPAGSTATALIRPTPPFIETAGRAASCCAVRAQRLLSTALVAGAVARVQVVDRATRVRSRCRRSFASELSFTAATRLAAPAGGDERPDGGCVKGQNVGVV
jgi:hypothetical protein